MFSDDSTSKMAAQDGRIGGSSEDDPPPEKTSELVWVVDDDDRPIGQIPRTEMRRQHLRHRAAFVLVFNFSGALYVERRTKTKDIYPGYYDPAVGGVILGGESYEDGALRELREELGIQNTELLQHGKFYFEDRHSKVWGMVFSCRYEGELTLQPEEVAGIELMNVDEVLLRATQELFAPDSLAALTEYLRLMGRLTASP